MLELMKAMWADEEGAAMVEYALMLALIAVVCILVVTALGLKVGQTLDLAQSQLPGN